MGAEDDEGGNVNYIMYAEEFIKSAFSEVTPCLQKEYADPNEEADEENEDEDEEEEEYQVNDYCAAIMEEDVVSYNNCEAQEEEEEEDNGNDDGNNYDMKEADDVGQVCAAINMIDSADYTHVYD